MTKKLLQWAIAAIIFSAATLTGCKKDNPNNNQWGAETLSFKVNNSSDEFILKKVEGGDYSMEYMYEDQVTNVKGTLSDFYISPVEVTNKLWDAVMGWRPEGQTNNGDSYPVSNVNYYDIVKEGGFIDKLNTMCADQLPNELGIYDMSGNVWEYCNDWYAELADLPAEQGTDYAGPESGEKIVGCGGCYSSDSYTCTYSYHGREKEHNGRDATVGFRIVLR